MKKTVCMILCLIFALSLYCTASAEGTVTISTETELVAFLTAGAGKYEKAVLASDITVKENYSPHDLSCPFDGNGHSVILKNKSTTLFSKITGDASVKNLIIKGSIGNKAGEAAAGICVENDGTIENCAVLADIAGKDSLYGICQTNKGKIYNCAVLCRPDTEGNPPYFWFPIAAENSGEIVSCYYIKEYAADTGEEGRALTEDECKNGKLLEELNARVDANGGMMRWSGKDGEYPGFDTENAGDTAVITVTVVTLAVLIAAAAVIWLVIRKGKPKKTE